MEEEEAFVSAKLHIGTKWRKSKLLSRLNFTLAALIEEKEAFISAKLHIGSLNGGKGSFYLG